ncbi:MAG TPA: urease accessory UreF family protein [Caldimonas sp.]|nr:urease accessory UreF family protein [Caldimonas sp.]HEX4234760.1 urease accessory UreF family protein [Caldimonas sp.]
MQPRRSIAHRRRDADAPLGTAALLQLIRLASPSLPVGGFSYSEGIEAAVEASLVRDEASARSWLLDQLELGIGRSELPVTARALAAWRRDDRKAVVRWNDWFATTRETSELRRQTEQMGRSLAIWLRQGDAGDARVAALEALTPAPTWPIAFALAAAGSAAGPRAVLASLAAGWAENTTQAALKAVPLGQAAAQRILAAIAAAIPAAVDRALAMAAAEMQAFAPMLAILSAKHEEQYSRLFRS